MMRNRLALEGLTRIRHVSEAFAGLQRIVIRHRRRTQHQQCDQPHRAHPQRATENIPAQRTAGRLLK